MKDSTCYECGHHPECPQYEYDVALDCICNMFPNPQVDDDDTKKKTDNRRNTRNIR